MCDSHGPFSGGNTGTGMTGGNTGMTGGNTGMTGGNTGAGMTGGNTGTGMTGGNTGASAAFFSLPGSLQNAAFCNSNA